MNIRAQIFTLFMFGNLLASQAIAQALLKGEPARFLSEEEAAERLAGGFLNKKIGKADQELQFIFQDAPIQIEWMPLGQSKLENLWNGLPKFNTEKIDIGPVRESNGGVVIGNGGKVVPCKTGDDEKVEYILLDYLRNKIEWPGLTLSLAEGSNEFEMAFNLLTRIKELDPSRFTTYTKWLLDFKKETSMLSSLNLHTTKDTSEAGLPTNCGEATNVINQRNPDQPDAVRYLISGNIWQNLNIETKAGLLVHELIYHEMLLLNKNDNEQRTADQVAYVTSLISSKQIQMMKREQYFERLSSVGLRYQLNGVELTSEKIHFGPKGEVLGGRVFSDTEIELSASRSLVVAKGSWVSFYPNGKIRDAWVKANDNFFSANFNARLIVGSGLLPLAMASFDNTGAISLLQVKNGSLAIQGMTLEIGEGVVSFYSDGSLKSFSLSTQIDKQKFKIQKNEVELSNVGEVELDQQGNFLSFFIKGAWMKNTLNQVQWYGPGKVILNSQGMVQKFYQHNFF